MPNVIDNALSDDFLEKKIEQRMTRRQREFWYIQGSAPDNKGRMRSFLLGPYSDSQKASEISSSKRLTSSNILCLPTADLGKASQILKARKLQGNSSISDVFDRLKHKGVGQDVI
jgi:hypothetical protein